MSPILEELSASDIVRDSIIQNKEKTKSYWEQLMMAAAANNGNIRNNSNRNSVCSVESGEDGPNVREEKRRIERELALANVPNIPNHLTMQEKIAEELKQMQLREEELRISRSLLEMKLSSQDGSNCSEYGSDESTRADSLRHRAQSMESVSSGLSSGSGTTGDISLTEVPRRKRSITVRPFDEPEYEAAPIKTQFGNETPIEREIRLACEREAELRRAKGIEDPKPKEEVSEAVEEGVKVKQEVSKASDQKTDPRNVQLRLATHRIEREIAEASERETQLRTMGRILTTSIDTVDSKVTRYTDLVEMTTLDKAKRTRRTISSTSLPDEDENQVKRKDINDSRKLLSSNSQRGLMQRFIASKGRLQVTPPQTPIILRPPSPTTQLITTPLQTPTRRGFLSAEEKIQSELKEMQRREEELRLQRAHSMARSQPNLSTIVDEEDEGRNGDSLEPGSLRHSSLPHFASNPNIALNKVPTTNGRRKRFSLLEEWENRIQNV